jgi:hypothetical protein
MIKIPGKPSECRLCGSALTLHQQFSGEICDDWRCREAVLREDFEAFRERAGRELEVEGAEKFPVSIVPHVTPELVPLPAERRAEFLANLSALIEDSRDVLGGHAPSGSRAAEEGPRRPPALLGRLCAACEGSCCYRGETHAFLELDTLRRTMDAHGLTLDQVADAYEAHLPERTVAGSCVYHTLEGCRLPRGMRAKICNTFECNALGDARRIIAGEGDPRAFLVRRVDNVIRSGAFVSESEVLRFPRTEDGA